MSASQSQTEVKLTSKGEPAKLAGGVVIVGFPESGLAGTIASSCLVSSLKLSLVGELASDYFPPLATVLDGKLQAPARVFADASKNMAIFMGDFSPGLRASHALARTIVDWAARKEAAFILTSFSTPMQEGVDEHGVSAVVNGPEAEEAVAKSGVPPAKLTAVGGVAGSLLLEGRNAGVPVVALLVKTHKGIQDHESGLKLAEAIMMIVPNAYCNLEAIREEAARTECNLRKVWRQTAPSGVYG